MKLNRSMNTSVMAAARSIEIRATAKSDTTILKAEDLRRGAFLLHVYVRLF